MCKLVQFEKDKYVAEIKLPYIKNISEQAGKTKYIDRIVLFGSSTGENCRTESDIDIAVFGSKTRGRYIDSAEFRKFKSALFRFDWEQNYDVLYFKEDDKYRDAIMNDIKDGVEIFRRVTR